MHYQLLSHIYQQFFYNNLTACHKKQQVFLELMHNHFVIHVIYQDIQDQLRECSLFDFFYQLKLYQTHQQIINIKVRYKF